jgi:hypothetical protein
MLSFAHVKNDHGSTLFVRGGRWQFGSLPLTTPSSDFIDNQNGTVTHKRTGLEWKRCAMGQTWTGTTCSGKAGTYHYYDIANYNVNGWRVPSMNELLSIAEYGSYNPAINTTLFPDTSSNRIFWSSSPNLSAGGSEYVHAINFYNGNYTKGDVYSSNYLVRLVRGGQQSFYDINKESAISIDFGSNYDAKNSKAIELQNTTANPIKVSNVIASDAGSYWVNLFVDNKTACRPVIYAQSVKIFTIPAQSSCKISIGFSPFDNLTAGKSIPATITLKTLINGIATDKVINVTGIGRTQVNNVYNNIHLFWGWSIWGVSQLKGGNPPINTTLVGAASRYSYAKYWYGSVIKPILQKLTPSIGNVVVFAENSSSLSGHVGVLIQTSPVVTMLSMNDITDAKGVKVRKWSVRPVDWYAKTAIWQPLITGINATDATKHYGFLNWNSSLY